MNLLYKLRFSTKLASKKNKFSPEVVNFFKIENPYTKRMCSPKLFDLDYDSEKLWIFF